jgi:hypothetical protein
MIFGEFLPMTDKSGRISPMITLSISDLQSNVIKDGATALVDTGSETTSIDEKLVSTLIVIKNNFEVRGAGGTIKTKTYGVGLSIDGHPRGVECAALSFRDSGYHFDLIIGMDLLHSFDLSINHSRRWISLSWVQT